MIFKRMLFLVAFLQHAIIVPHGFAESIFVWCEEGQDRLPIKVITKRFFKGQISNVCSFKEKSQKWKIKPVQAVAYCQSEAYFELSFAKNHKSSAETIQCSPLQLFYRVSDLSSLTAMQRTGHAWVAASDLREGDRLLCKDNAITCLQSKKYIQEPIKLYIIEVKKHHTFVVGKQKILTHNMFIPIATTIAVAIPFDMILSASSFGCMFGPVSFCCSVAVAGVAAAIAYQCGKEKHTDFVLKCESIGHYEMLPKHHHAGCGSMAPNLGSFHKATVDDILNGTKEQGSTRGISKIYEKPGTSEDALKDFDNLDLTNREKFKDSSGKEGQTGFLPDGRKVTVRITSSDERATLAITPLKNAGGKIIKIRYGEKLSENK